MENQEYDATSEFYTLVSERTNLQPYRCEKNLKKNLPNLAKTYEIRIRNTCIFIIKI